MIRSGLEPHFYGVAFIAAMAILVCPPLDAATPYNQASVTRIENAVSYGSIKGGASTKRAAAVSDVVRANNFLFTETDSRAELQYEDGSLVRIGQNTVFSFDASSRTLALDKGSFIFYVPKGSGGGTIKTPSLTAAITGTVGKVSPNMIAIIEGVVVLKPSGRQVRAGQFARRNPDGTIDILPFDLNTAFEGKLMNFNGPLPGVDERRFHNFKPDLSTFDDLERAQNLPGSIQHFFPPSPPRPKEKKEPQSTPIPATPTPRKVPIDGGPGLSPAGFTVKPS